MKKEAWRETGKMVRERWRICLSEYASLQMAEWCSIPSTPRDRSYKKVDPETLLIELPFGWLSDGFANGFDPSRFSAERKRQHAGKVVKQRYWNSDDRNGRPRGEALRVAAAISCYFYDEWLGENRKRGIRDYGYRVQMKDCAVEVIVEDYFAWRFRVRVRPVFIW